MRGIPSATSLLYKLNSNLALCIEFHTQHHYHTDFFQPGKVRGIPSATSTLYRPDSSLTQWHRKCSTNFLKRMREGHRQSDENWNCFNGETWETESWGGAHKGFPDHTDTILNWIEPNLVWWNRSKKYQSEISYQLCISSVGAVHGISDVKILHFCP